MNPSSDKPTSEENLDVKTESKCGHCNGEFQDKFSYIVVEQKYSFKNSFKVEEIEENDNKVSILEAVALIYGLQKEVMLQNKACLICKDCCEILTSLYNTYGKFLKLGTETSYLSKCVQFLHDKVPSSRPPPKKRGRKKKNFDLHEKIAPAHIINVEAFNTGATPKIDFVQQEDVDASSLLQIFKVETEDDWSGLDHDDDNFDQQNSPIRRSLRQRKVRKQYEEGEPTSSNNDTTVDGKDEEEAVTIPPPDAWKLKSKKCDIISQLWEICHGDKLYYDELNLAINQQGRYICPEEKCPKTFTGLKTLNRHSLSHDLKRTYTCFKCHEDFGNLSEIKHHLRSVHLKVRPSSQARKILSRKKKRYLKANLPLKNVRRTRKRKSKHKEGPHKCDQCEYSSLTELALVRHLASVHPKPMPQSRCVPCNKLFPTVLNLINHVRSFHNEDSKESSDDEDSSSDTGKDHKSTELVDPLASLTKKPLSRKYAFEDYRFGCSECEKSFPVAKSLRRHLTQHIDTEPLYCEICGKSFKRRDHLLRHKNNIHNNPQPRKERKLKEKQRYRCSECGKDFSRKEYLTLHENVHTGVKPFMCPHCGKTFRDPRNLAQHLVTHNSERPFCCSVCGMTFKRAHHLKDHENTHKTDAARPFVCEVPSCGKSFKLRKHLISHQTVHSGSKNHACPVCGKSFNRKDNLRQHITNLHGKDFLLQLDSQKPTPEQDFTSLNTTTTSSGSGVIFKTDINDASSVSSSTADL